jgi:hypothetical protein
MLPFVMLRRCGVAAARDVAKLHGVRGVVMLFVSRERGIGGCHRCRLNFYFLKFF